MTNETTMTGGQVLVRALKDHNVDTVFGVAGESYLAALDALYDARGIKFVTNRQEGGGAFMAEAYGKLTGKTGICFVTRGPGATNASIGVHTARQDSTPMILFIGQVARDQMGREAFQEIDYRQMFKPPIAKAVFEVSRASDMAEIVSEAFRLSQSGRMGPVVVSLPEDVLTETTDKTDVVVEGVKVKTDISRELQDVSKLLSSAEKPVCILGGSGWSDRSLHEFQTFAEKHYLPVACSFRRQDLFDHNSPSYIGELGTGANPELVRYIREEADLVIALNTRMSEITSQGYTLLDVPRPRQKLVHVYPNIDELGKVYAANVGVLSKPNNFVSQLDQINVEKSFKDWCGQLNQNFQSWSTISKTAADFDVDMDLIYKILIENLPEDAIITTDAGNFSGWAQRYIKYGRPGRLLAPTSGAMGYGVPSAISASIASLDKTVVGLMGDGGFMMTAQELATAAQQKAKPILILFNNGIFGTIRMHQARDYPHRPIATELYNPDFTKLVKSYGLNAFKVTKTEDFADALGAAMESDKLSVIEVQNSPEQITTTKTMSQIEY